MKAKYFIKNRSLNYQRILKHWFAPGDKGDLETLFVEFSTDSERVPAMFGKDEFDKFISWVMETVEADPSNWEIIVPKNWNRPEVEEKEIEEENPWEEQLQSKSEKEYTGYNLAWLPYNEETKKIIARYPNAKELRKAEKIASGLAGRGKLRDLLNKRILELESQGKYA